MSDAADSDCGRPFGDRHIPGAYEAGDFSPQKELEIMYGSREERKRERERGAKCREVECIIV